MSRDIKVDQSHIQAYLSSEIKLNFFVYYPFSWLNSIQVVFNLNLKNNEMIPVLYLNYLRLLYRLGTTFSSSSLWKKSLPTLTNL